MLVRGADPLHVVMTTYHAFDGPGSTLARRLARVGCGATGSSGSGSNGSGSISSGSISYGSSGSGSSGSGSSGSGSSGSGSSGSGSGGSGSSGSGSSGSGSSGSGSGGSGSSVSGSSGSGSSGSGSGPGGVEWFPCTFSKFKDGSDDIEIGGFSPVNQHAGKHVLYCMPHSNNDVMMQSLHVLTVLLESQIASLTVVCPFVPTATMERVTKEGVVATASTTARILSGLPNCGAPVRYMFYDLHTLGHRFYFHAPAVAELHSTVDAVCSAVQGDFDFAFFPDGGALKRFGSVLENAGLWQDRVGTCEKVRRGEERIITVQGDHDLTGMRVLLIDDLVRTGNTLLQSARALRHLGARSVSAFCAHAAGSVDELQRLARDGALDALYLTDTVEARPRSAACFSPRKHQKAPARSST